MPRRMPELLQTECRNMCQKEKMLENMSDRTPEHVPEWMPERMSENMWDRLPEYVPEYMPDRLPVYVQDTFLVMLTQCSGRLSAEYSAMVAITRGKLVSTFRL